MDPRDLWYKRGVIYCVDVETFLDGNGDGIGDFQGLTEKLDYIHDLGVTAVWLLPFYASPFVIHRYCGPGSRAKVMANGGTRDLLSDRRLRTSLDLHRNRWR